jgi:hypothetical protein
MDAGSHLRAIFVGVVQEKPARELRLSVLEPEWQNRDSVWDGFGDDFDASFKRASPNVGMLSSLAGGDSTLSGASAIPCVPAQTTDAEGDTTADTTANTRRNSEAFSAEGSPRRRVSISLSLPGSPETDRKIAEQIQAEGPTISIPDFGSELERRCNGLFAGFDCEETLSPSGNFGVNCASQQRAQLHASLHEVKAAQVASEMGAANPQAATGGAWFLDALCNYAPSHSRILLFASVPSLFPTFHITVVLAMALVLILRFARRPLFDLCSYNMCTAC